MSALPLPFEEQQSEKHTISVRVHDRPGVLSRVAQVFARRGFNIDSLVVSRGHQPGFSRMTISCLGDRSLLDQVVKQLDKLVDTVRAEEYVPDNSVARELALFKIHVAPDNRADVFQMVEVFKGKTVDISNESVTVEITGSSEKLDAFERLTDAYGLIEMVRSGKLLIVRGSDRTA